MYICICCVLCVYRYFFVEGEGGGKLVATVYDFIQMGIICALFTLHDFDYFPKSRT